MLPIPRRGEAPPEARAASPVANAIPGMRSRAAAAGDPAILPGVPRAPEATPVTSGRGRIQFRQRASMIDAVPDADEGQRASLDVWAGASRSEFKAISVLGVGGFGEVKLVKYERNGEVYAMKSIVKADIRERHQMGDQTATDALMAERNFGAEAWRWQCPFIIELYSTFQNAEKLYYIYEFCPGGEIFSLVRNQPEGHLEEVTARFYSAEIVLALSYLHDKNVIHRDVKLENVLLAKDGHVKLADFGCVRSHLPEIGTNSYVASTDPRIFMPPEFRRREMYGKDLDCWQLGVATFAMMQGYYPERTAAERLHFSPSLSEESRNICSELLVLEREQRLGYPDGARMVCSHPFFKDIDWGAFRSKDVDPPFAWEEDEDGEGDPYDVHCSHLRPRCGTQFNPVTSETADQLRLRGFSFAQAHGLDTPKELAPLDGSSSLLATAESCALVLPLDSHIEGAEQDGSCCCYPGQGGAEPT